MNIAKNVSILIISLTAIGGVGYNLYRTPCDSPLTYRVDTVDKEFGLSQKDFLQYINDGAKLWNDSEGKEVLRYDPDGKVKISLIYDLRQQETIKANMLKAQVEEDKKNLDEIKTNIDEMKNIFTQKEAEYTSKLNSYQSRLNQYNADVKYWNDKGGAPRNEYNRLQTERSALEQQENDLQKDASDLQQLADTVNTNVQRNNNIVDNVNTKIGEINKNSGKEFEEGVYANIDSSITIYQYSNILDLKRVLAHELGHALGLDHTDGKESIMYYLNTGKVFKLSTEDKAELTRVCNQPYLLMMIGRVI